MTLAEIIAKRKQEQEAKRTTETKQDLIVTEQPDGTIAVKKV